MGENNLFPSVFLDPFQEYLRKDISVKKNASSSRNTVVHIQGHCPKSGVHQACVHQAGRKQLLNLLD